MTIEAVPFAFGYKKRVGASGCPVIAWKRGHSGAFDEATWMFDAETNGICMWEIAFWTHSSFTWVRLEMLGSTHSRRGCSLS